MSVIAIIVPVYKVEATLDKCVKSILSQSFKDFSLILVDDGSPDRCGEMCDEYGEKDGRIKVIHRPNGGLSAARNTGLEWALANTDCEWFVFIDSDDWVNEFYLEKLLEMRKADTQILLSSVVIENDKGVHLIGPKESGYVSPEDIYDKHNLLAVWAASKVFRREIISGVRFREGIIQEDEFFTYQIFFTNGLVGYATGAEYHYVQRKESIVGGKWNAKRLICVDGMKAQWSFFDEHKLYVARNHVEERFLQWLAVAIIHMKVDCPNDVESQSYLQKELATAKNQYRGASKRSPAAEYAVGLALHPRMQLIYKVRYAIRIILNKGVRFFFTKLLESVRGRKV